MLAFFLAQIFYEGLGVFKVVMQHRPPKEQSSILNAPNILGEMTGCCFYVL